MVFFNFMGNDFNNFEFRVVIGKFCGFGRGDIVDIFFVLFILEGFVEL